MPNFDEIGDRRAELATQIEEAYNLQRLQTSYCDKRLCVKVIESKFNYDSNGDRYRVADLR